MIDFLNKYDRYKRVGLRLPQTILAKYLILKTLWRVGLSKLEYSYNITHLFQFFKSKNTKRIKDKKNNMQGINTNQKLSAFHTLLMDKVKVSNKDYFQIIRSKKHASKYPHIQYNHLSGVNYLAVDIDSDVFNMLEETNLSPNLG